MIVIKICPDCGAEVKTEPWVSGKCPGCGKEYYFDEVLGADGDEWPEFSWDEEED